MDRRTYAPLRLPAHLPRSVCEPLYDFYGDFCNAAWFPDFIRQHRTEKSAVPFCRKAYTWLPGIFTIDRQRLAVIPHDPFNMQHKKWTNPWDSSISSVESFFDLYGRSEEKYLHCLAELSALLKERIHSPKASLLTEEFLKDYGNASFHSGLDCTI